MSGVFRHFFFCSPEISALFHLLLQFFCCFEVAFVQHSDPYGKMECINVVSDILVFFVSSVNFLHLLIWGAR